MPLPEAPPAIELPHIASEFEAAAGTVLPTVSVIRPRCAAGKAGEIVVCAADPARNRLPTLPEGPQEGLPRAEARLSKNASIELHVQSAQISGAPSNRAMVGVKIGF
jgi:hypothetical protein